MMRIEELRPAKFKELEDDEEFWKPLRSGQTPASMDELLGPYYAYDATGHVLNKIFDLPRRLEDHELMRVAFDPARKELYLMQPSDIVYIGKS
ncbi:hypothetical protein U14_05218 [Candidatus Moduliflexus flocculans]|uniref:Uncharacterized protein n=1 Tax=Candidatus Moduliflexus flocculans TaxID=1499966 RepID=A0A081BRB0_9BACT|nr:hypothetical protein U14_05218 [Candidatus Moduliflexus flocculans]